MTTDSKPRKVDVQKLQRAIVNGLEDVKAQDIRVFNTEHLSPLFERVIVASGTSNRQTKALASSVSDAVKDAGFPKPRTEGEDNGEWIIVDCGQAVVHVMQPTIRAYYNLEEIWGGKVVRMKPTAAPKAVAVAAKPATAKRAPTKASPEAVAKKPVARKAAVGASPAVAAKSSPKVAVSKPSQSPAKRAAPAKAKPVAQPEDKPQAKKTTAKLATVVVGTPARKAVAKKATTTASTRRKPAA